MSCGVIIPLSLRAYYDDLEVQFKAMGVLFIVWPPIRMNGLCGLLFIRQPFPVSNGWLSVQALKTDVRAEGMEYITLQPEWGGLVRAFFKVL